MCKKQYCWHFLVDICSDYLQWKLALALCRENLLWLFAIRIWRGYLPRRFPAAICHENLPLLFSMEMDFPICIFHDEFSNLMWKSPNFKLIKLIQIERVFLIWPRTTFMLLTRSVSNACISLDKIRL